MDRRTFLALSAGALGLAGCTADRPPSPDPTTGTPTPADPDDALRARAAQSELALLAAYRATSAAHPEVAAELGVLAEHHEEHLRRMAPELAASGPAAPVPTARGAIPSASADGPAPVPSGTPDPSAPADQPGPDPSGAPRVPAGRRAALRALAEAEQRTQRAHTSACDGAADPDLVRALCLMAASEAQHAEVLAVLGRVKDGR